MSIAVSLAFIQITAIAPMNASHCQCLCVCAAEVSLALISLSLHSSDDSTPGSEPKSVSTQSALHLIIL